MVTGKEDGKWTDENEMVDPPPARRAGSAHDEDRSSVISSRAEQLSRPSAFARSSFCR